jgi:hypothetical protein
MVVSRSGNTCESWQHVETEHEGKKHMQKERKNPSTKCAGKGERERERERERRREEDVRSLNEALSRKSYTDRHINTIKRNK